ncbi:MAG: coproporphyrinogen dehydrogenase HemZ, partial [Oscillospiraceae bacterium]|nr:coproporphyrinogen dehydrogenase HemZ [Oscillospiraceae bacterium]
ITIHTLSLKKGTRITLEGTPIPDGESVRLMLDHAKERLSGAGYAPYYLYKQKFMSGGFENVGWSLRGFENLYNVAIMEELCSIIALGGGGVTKLLNNSTGKLERIFNAKYPYEYIDRIETELEKKRRLISFYSENEP